MRALTLSLEVTVNDEMVNYAAKLIIEEMMKALAKALPKSERAKAKRLGKRSCYWKCGQPRAMGRYCRICREAMTGLAEGLGVKL